MINYSARLRSCGDSGWIVQWRNWLIISGLEGRLPKLRTISSTGKEYSLQIIPSTNSFLVLMNNISQSTVVGTILHPAGPAHAPLSGWSAWTNDLVMESGDDLKFVLAISGDEKPLCRMSWIQPRCTRRVAKAPTQSDNLIGRK
ncbi:hypothetical protein F5146DRAFT_1006751 [Armillaria mellea]|nr:hypothetical protein F5146DRAFT_1006751 [Armillaria mellea]